MEQDGSDLRASVSCVFGCVCVRVSKMEQQVSKYLKVGESREQFQSFLSDSD